MIRKATIVALTIAAAICAAGWAVTVARRNIQIHTGCTILLLSNGAVGYIILAEQFCGPQYVIVGEASPWRAMIWWPQIRDQGFSAVIPLWIPFVLFAAYPTYTLIREPLCRRRRKRAGACFRCGYDLTGNVTGVCPECGHEIEGAA